MRRQLARVGGLIWLALASAQARADADQVLLLETRTEPASPRLGAELTVLGLEPRRVLVDHAPELDELQALARREQAGLAVWIETTADGARVSIVDRVTGKALQREVSVESGDSERAASIALSAVELVRASLLELASPERPPGELAPGRVHERIAGARAARLGLELGFALSATPKGPAPLAQLRAGGELQVASWLELALAALVPVHPLILRSDEGSAELRSSSLLFSARISPPGAGARFSPYLGFGGFGTLVNVRGRAREPYQSEVSHALSGGPTLELGARVALGGGFGVRCAALAAFSLSSFNVRFGDDQVARFGQPMLSGSCGLDLWL